MIKQHILDISTFIGGLAAIWFFGDLCDKNNYCFPVAALIIVLAAVGWFGYRWRNQLIKPETTNNVEGPLAWDSPFYVERPPAESKSYTVITQPGAHIRIIAPRQMGKTSLMMRINHHAEVQQYRTVYLSLDQVGGAELQSLDQFLQWFCISVTRKLQLPVEKVTVQWTDSILGYIDNCTEYFENVLLKEIHQPLVLSVDKLDKLFQYENLAGDFFGLLHAWHVQSVQNDI